MLVYGPSGAGKKTRIACTLRELFGKGADKVRLDQEDVGAQAHPWFFVKQLKIDQRVFMTPSKRKLDVNVVQSNFHIEINPRYGTVFSQYFRLKTIIELVPLRSEVGSYDRVVIQEILKEIAQTQQVDLNAKQRFKGSFMFHYFCALHLTSLI